MNNTESSPRSVNPLSRILDPPLLKRGKRRARAQFLQHIYNLNNDVINRLTIDQNSLNGYVSNNEDPGYALFAKKKSIFRERNAIFLESIFMIFLYVALWS